MNISPQEWTRLSQLLDEALELQVADRDGWLNRLSSADRPLGETLRKLLSQQGALETRDALNTPPDFAGALLAESQRHRAAATELEAGARLGAYLLVRELGRGGMGSVWLAERVDGQLKRQVALKFPYAGPLQRELAERLVRERDILASLEHPNIARLYDASVSASGQPFLVLEYVDGVPIGTYCDAQHLTLRQRLTLFLQVLSAVQFAHSRLVIHRDLKPSNILVTCDGVPRLLDFGIAKLVSEGEAAETALTHFTGRALTPDYASPEQIAGRPVTTASDVYALGVVLYELLTGTRPYQLARENRVELERAIAEAQIVAPSRKTVGEAARALRGDIDTVVLKALERDVSLRYGSCDALARDVRALIDGDAVEARPATLAYRTRKLVSRHRVAFVAGLAVLLAIVAGAGVALWQAGVARDNEARALAEAKTANAVKQFMTGIFSTNTLSQKDPAKARQATALELLERGADRVARDFKDDPELARELMGTILPLLAESRSGQYQRYALEYAKLLAGKPGAEVQVADIYNELSTMSQGGDLAEARRLAEQGLQALGPSDDPAHRLIRGKLLTSTGAAWLEAGDYNKAEPSLIQARDLLARDHRNTVEYGKALGNIGWVALRRDQLDIAEQNFEAAMKAYKADPGVYERTLGLGLYDVAVAHQLRSNLGAAEQELRQAVAIFERSYGVEDPQTAINAAKLGSIVSQRMRYTEAIGILEPAVRRLEKPSPQFNVYYLATGVEYLADALVWYGDLEKAAPAASRAVKLNETDSPIYRINSYLIAARLGALQGDERQAVAHAMAAVGAADSSFDAGNTKRLKFRADAADVLIDIGRHGDAEALLKPALAAAKPTSLPSAWSLATLRLARALTARGRGAEAQALLIPLAKEFTALPAERHDPNLEAELRMALARAQLSLGQAAPAQVELQRVLELRASQHPDSPRLAEVRLALADCLLRLGDAAGAKQQLAQARAILARTTKLNPRYSREYLALSRRQGMS